MFKILKKCKHKNVSDIVNIYGNPMKYNNASTIKLCNECHKILFKATKKDKYKTKWREIEASDLL